MVDFAAIRQACDGMLRADVYEALHETASRHPDGQFVEIGTAHGAGTICIALAMSAGHTFDSFRKGGRQAYRGDNETIARANLKAFGVDDRVSVYPGDVETTLPELTCDKIDLLFLDCDGRIDRDIRALGGILKPGASVIIDDCADRARVRIRDWGTARIDMKHRLTWLLTQSLVDDGFLIPERTVHQTWFGTWAGRDAREWSDMSIIAAYRGLVFGDGEIVA